MGKFFYTDMHTHILFGVDDGSQSFEQSEKMIALAYASGTRRICLTPHSPQNDEERLDVAFEKLRAMCAEKYPDLTLMRGSEICFCIDSAEDISDGRCIKLGESDYYLVDLFLYDEIGADEMIKELRNFMKQGYKVIIAHPERYSTLYMQTETIAKLREKGALVQMNSASLFSTKPKVKKFAKRLLEENLVDMIASDAHDAKKRAPILSKCDKYITKKYGETYAYRLLRETSDKVLGVK